MDLCLNQETHKQKFGGQRAWLVALALAKGATIQIFEQAGH